jgi:hypothetical protein
MGLTGGIRVDVAPPGLDGIMFDRFLGLAPQAL